MDTTGTTLHKRGYRPAANEAPIRETLAAALCAMSRLRPYHTLYDPMCGSGTILIEGAMLVQNIAPGLHRHFTAERFPQIPPEVWREEREKAQNAVVPAPDFQAFGSDIDEEALKIAEENAVRAGVRDKIFFRRSYIRDFKPAT